MTVMFTVQIPEVQPNLSPNPQLSSIIWISKLDLATPREQVHNLPKHSIKFTQESWATAKMTSRWPCIWVPWKFSRAP